MINDEIKEILNRFELVKKEPNKLSYYPEDLLTREEMWLLYDYITNLQQKVDQYENPDDLTLFYMWLDEKAKDKIKELEKENERLSVELNKNMIERNNYLSRNEKAIDYLHHFDSDEICENITGISKILLKILQGEDKDE